MTSDQAKSYSVHAKESGYAEWLVEQLRKSAIAKFEAADETDGDALVKSRIMYTLATELRTIISDNAR